MQVKHEARLLEPSPLTSGGGELVGATAANQALDLYCLSSSHSNLLNPIRNLACGSTATGLIAVHVASTNHIILFDAKTHKRCDRFPLKSCDKRYSRQSFQVSAMDFSHDGQRLAIGQTDCIIYIYKLAQTITPTGNPVNSASNLASDPIQSGAPTRPTTISGKFTSASPITCLIWSELGILFGTQDGRVRLVASTSGQQRSSNVAITNGTGPTLAPPDSLHQTSTSGTKIVQIFNSSSMGSMPISLAFKAPLLLIGQLDCRLQLLLVEHQTGASQETATIELDHQAASSRRNSSIGVPSVQQALTLNHTCPPLHVHLLPGQAICCSGSDGRLVFHRLQSVRGTFSSSQTQVIDLKEDILSADYSPINEVLALATRTRLLFVKRHQVEAQDEEVARDKREAGSWRLQPALIELANQFGLASLRWLRDGTQLALGHSNCALDLFKCNWQKQTVNEELDICHIARNRVRVMDRGRNSLAIYKTQHDIKRVNILDANQNVLIWTSGSLLLARLDCGLQSEIKWPPAGTRRAAATSNQLKFLFEASGFVVIYSEHTSECHLVRLGDNFISLSLKMVEPARADRLSVRRFPPIGQLWQSNLPNSETRQQPTGSLRNPSNLDDPEAPGDEYNSLPVVGEPPVGAQMNETPSVRNEASQSELFAYVMGDKSNELNIIDLKQSGRLFYAQTYSQPIERIKLGWTGQHLIVLLGEGGHSKRLLVLQIEADQSGRVAEALAFDKCHFADWLPETDSLVAQIGSNLKLWYDLDEKKRVETIDLRAFNYVARVPLLDLSDKSWSREQSLQQLVEQLDDQRLELVLNNGQRVPLDKFDWRFHCHLARGQLASCFELLQRQPAGGRQSQVRRLCAKLGWMAIERGQCQLALRIFDQIEYKKLVSYLEECSPTCDLAQPVGNELENGDQETRRNHGAISLAKLCGQWAKFEQLAGDQELILATYKRLNKWSLCLDYLTRTQQFRQRDIAEQERQQWLMSRGRYRECAELLLRHSGDLPAALDLLLANRQLLAAADLLVLEQKSPINSSSQQWNGTQTERRLLELANAIKAQLIEQNERFRAAKLSDQVLGQPSEALELFLEAGDYASALEVGERVTDIGEEKLRRLHLELANQMRQAFRSRRAPRRQALPAIEHFISAADPLDAVEFALELDCHGRARSLIELHGDGLRELKSVVSGEQRNELMSRLGSLGNQFTSLEGAENKSTGVELLLLAERFGEAIDLLLELNHLERAYQVALVELNGGDRKRTSELFIELAAKMAQDETQLKKAEQLYLLLGRPELAIGMYRQLEKFDDMLDLIEAHQMEKLEGSLLQLARSLESQGRFNEAERYLIRASPTEWTNVVRMYRLAERWTDAFRVARAHCLADQDPLLVQLAYWWARSLVKLNDPAEVDGGNEEVEKQLEESRRLLNELGLIKQVVEFCCETKQFQFALDLLGPSDSRQRHQVALRYAAHLERQHNFEQAESVLVSEGQVELAARMYLDNEQPDEAIRLVERQLAATSPNDGSDRAQLVELLNRTLVECGQKIAFDLANSLTRSAPIMRQPSGGGATSRSQQMEARLQMAQKMFLRAQQPGLAVQMYQSLGMWQEAIQVAQRFAPRLLEDVERALDEQVNEDIGPILRSSQPTESNDEPKLTERPDDKSSGSVSGGGNNSSESGKLDLLWQSTRQLIETNDRKAARLSFAKYLDLLAVSLSSTDLVAKQLDRMAKFLSSNASKAFVSTLFGQQDNCQRLLGLTGQLLVTAAWDGPIWLPMRNLLAKWPPASEQSDGFKRHLLLSHHLTTYTALESFLQEAWLIEQQQQQQAPQKPSFGADSRRNLFGRKRRRERAHVPGATNGADHPPFERDETRALTVKQVEKLGSTSAKGSQTSAALDLLAKLSLGLLQHADLLDATQILAAAGLWQLSTGRRELAREIWSALLELTEASDGQTSRKVTNWRPPCMAKLTNLPDSIRANTGGVSAGGQRRLAEIRNWLVESLMSSTMSQLTASALTQFPAALIRSSSGPACLICGLPTSEPIQAGVELSFHTPELATLAHLAGLPPIDSRPDHYLSELNSISRSRKSKTEFTSRTLERLREIICFGIDLVGTPGV